MFDGAALGLSNAPHDLLRTLQQRDDCFIRCRAFESRLGSGLHTNFTEPFVFRAMAKRLSTHRIRLAGPWTVLPAGNESELVRVKLPIEWDAIPIQNAHSLVFRRTFHQPSGLEAESRVWIELPVEPVGVRLDETPLRRDTGRNRYDITALLTGFHSLEIEIATPPGLSEPVWLVIEN